MTFSAGTLVFSAGILTLLTEVFSLLAVRSARKKGDLPPLPFEAKSLERIGRPNHFARLFFSLLAIFLSDDLTHARLGAVLCLGMALYFALHAWAQLRSPEVRNAGPAFFSYLEVLASILLLVGIGLSWNVI